jgi:UDP-N-acetylmuramate dehydrogenase
MIATPGDLPVRKNVPMSALTSLGVGGAARFFVEATTESVVVRTLEWARLRSLPLWILGGGSNVVLPDEGLDGVVLQVALRGVDQANVGTRVEVTAAAGEPWDEFVRDCVIRDLSGVECLSGIPGLVGATPVQNVGAYGQEVADSIVRVRVVDRRDGTTMTLDRNECAFAYRDSRFKGGEPDRFVVVAVTYALVAGGAPRIAYAELERRLSATPEPTLAETREAVLVLRRAKSMAVGCRDENARSCGSFFVNPIVDARVAEAIARSFPGVPVPRHPQPGGRIKLSAAWLIERSGFAKGHRAGNVGLSTRHALAIVCHDGATANDVASFADEVRRRVRERFDVELEPEPSLWGFARAPA